MPSPLPFFSLNVWTIAVIVTLSPTASGRFSGRPSDFANGIASYLQRVLVGTLLFKSFLLGFSDLSRFLFISPLFEATLTREILELPTILFTHTVTQSTMSPESNVENRISHSNEFA